VADNLAKLMDSMRNAVRLDPNDGETQLVLGHAFAYHGMPEQALEQFAKAEALAPHNADVLILIAWFLPHSLFVEGARKAGVAACVPAHKVLSMPNLIRIKACDEERARQAAG
jgi:Tfp pilus assembly protein PilF